MAEVGFEGDAYEQGIASPIDCWELVSSSPSSPSPQATVNISSWEPPVSDSSALLQDDYIGREASGWNVDVVPASMAVAMADKQLENDILSDKLNVLEDASVGTMIGMPEMVSEMPYALGKYYARDGLYVMYEDYQGGNIPDNSITHCSEIMEQDDKLMDQAAGIQTVMGANSNRLSCKVPKTYHDISSTHSTVATSSPIKQWASPVHVHTTSYDNSKNTDIVHPCSALVPAKLDAASQADDGAGRSPRVPVPFYSSRRLNELPCAKWIFTQLRRWQVQLKCANTIWSVAFAAALMGILFLGRSWQHLQVQNRFLQTQLSAKEKKITQLMFRLMQAKETLCKTRRVPVIWAKPSLQVPQDHI